MNFKYIYIAFDDQLIRANINKGLSDPINFGKPIPAGAIIWTKMSDNPNLTIEEVVGYPNE